jgi:hypothetical protein
MHELLDRVTRLGHLLPDDPDDIADFDVDVLLMVSDEMIRTIEALAAIEGGGSAKPV